MVAWSSAKIIQTEQLRKQQLQSLQQEKHLLEEANTKTKVEKENLEKAIKAKDQEISNLKQSKAKAVNVAYAQVAYPLPDNEAKAYIYNHESGNNPTRWNSSGCLGLGQACPASKLLAVCPTMDYACEDAWFSNYAVSRYGGWQGAYSFWIAHRWW